MLADGQARPVAGTGSAIRDYITSLSGYGRSAVRRAGAPALLVCRVPLTRLAQRRERFPSARGVVFVFDLLAKGGANHAPDKGRHQDEHSAGRGHA